MMHSSSRASWMMLVVLVGTVLVPNPAAGQRDKIIRTSTSNQQQNRLTPPATNTNLVSDSVTDLAQRIARSLANTKSKTEIFSPVSIAGALSLLLLGSGGQTQHELLRVMGLDKGQLSFQDIHKGFGRLFQDLVSNDPSLEPLVTWRQNDKCNRYEEDEDDEEFAPALSPSNPNESPSHRISVANGLFLQSGLKPSERFLSVIQMIYQSTVQNLDFERGVKSATVFINDWCSKATNGKIKEIVNERILQNSRMVVASAVYFKAKWETTFSPYGTKIRPFYPNGQSEPAISVESMATSGCFPYYNAKADYDVQIIGLPYETGKSTMYIILPYDSSRQKLQHIQSTLGPAHLNWMIDRMTIKKGMVVMPKLSISNGIQLSNILSQLGLNDLFNPSRSNLSNVLDESASAQPRPSSVPSSVTESKPNVQAVVRPTTKPPVRPEPQMRPQTQAPPQKYPLCNTIEIMLPVNECQSNANCMFYNGKCYCCVQNKQPEVQQQSNNVPTSPNVPQTTTAPPRQVANRFGPETSPAAPNPIPNPANNGWVQKTCNAIANVNDKNYCTYLRYSWDDAQRVCFDQASCQVVRHRQKRQQNASFGQAQVFSRPSQQQPSQQQQRQQQGQQPYQPELQQRTPQQEHRQQGYQQQQKNEPLFVNEIITHVTLDVNEEGTEGGAVTLALVDRIGPGYTVLVNGPFMILIRHDSTKLPLFYGAVYDPRP